MPYRDNVGSGGSYRRSLLSRIMDGVLRSVGRLSLWRVRFLFGEDREPEVPSKRPAVGLREADLTEEQRREAVEKIRRKPRTG